MFIVTETAARFSELFAVGFEILSKHVAGFAMENSLIIYSTNNVYSNILRFLKIIAIKFMIGCSNAKLQQMETRTAIEKSPKNL